MWTERFGEEIVARGLRHGKGHRTASDSYGRRPENGSISIEHLIRLSENVGGRSSLGSSIDKASYSRSWS